MQEQVEQRIAEKAAGKKDWDDDVEEADINAIDDTDGVDPDAEYAAWKLRELKRIKRERLAIEEAEAERAEIERRRNLSAAEREAEDRAHIEKQQEEKGDRGQMQYMQKYFHKGAFFTDELKELGVDRRNLMNARFEDETNREILPEYMQIRDMTKLGKKGRTRYRDMKTEDTGKWGDFGDDRPRRDKGDFGVDERFRPEGYHHLAFTALGGVLSSTQYHTHRLRLSVHYSSRTLSYIPRPLTSPSAMARASSLPFSTSNRHKSGAGSTTNTARKMKAGRIVPAWSTIQPTRAGPKALLPLSVTAYNAKNAASLPSGINGAYTDRAYDDIPPMTIP